MSLIRRHFLIETSYYHFYRAIIYKHLYNKNMHLPSAISTKIIPQIDIGCQYLYIDIRILYPPHTVHQCNNLQHAALLSFLRKHFPHCLYSFFIHMGTFQCFLHQMVLYRACFLRAWTCQYTGHNPSHSVCNGLPECNSEVFLPED